MNQIMITPAANDMLVLPSGYNWQYQHNHVNNNCNNYNQ